MKIITKINTVAFVILLGINNVTAQRLDTFNMPVYRTTKKSDTIPVDLTPKKTKNGNDDLLRDIQRDLDKYNNLDKKNNAATSEKPSEKVVERIIERVVKDPRKPIEPYRHEIQLEAGAIFNQLFRLLGLTKDAQPYEASPYFIAYKYKFRKNTEGFPVLRIGAGGFYDSRNDTRGGFLDNKTTDSLAINGRIGVEFQKKLDDFWVGHIGLDVLVGRSEKRITADSGFDKFIQKTAGMTTGLALLAGIRWDFSARASVGTEINLQFTTFKGAQDEIFTANPQFNKRVFDIQQSKTRFIGPANIYLSLRF